MLLKVRVIPRAKKNAIREEAEITKIYLTAPPVKGKANKALIKFLSGHYKVKKRNISIIKGEKSRNKLVEIGGK